MTQAEGFRLVFARLQLHLPFVKEVDFHHTIFIFLMQFFDQIVLYEFLIISLREHFPIVSVDETLPTVYMYLVFSEGFLEVCDGFSISSTGVSGSVSGHCHACHLLWRTGSGTVLVWHHN